MQVKITNTINSRFFLKYFEISIPQHIRFAKLREKYSEQPHFTNEYVIWLLKVEIYRKYCAKKGEIAPWEQFLPFSTIFCYLLLDFHVKTGTRFTLGDKGLLKISEVEIMRVDCMCLVCTESSTSSAKHHSKTWTVTKLQWNKAEAFMAIWSHSKRNS